MKKRLLRERRQVVAEPIKEEPKEDKKKTKKKVN